MLLIIIIIIIVIVAFLSIVSSSRNVNSIPSAQDEAVIIEVLSYIESVKLLYVGNTHLDAETLGCFQIIPIDERKEMYRLDSCRILLMLLIYDDYDWRIQSVLTTAEINNSPFGSYFHTETITGHTQFAAYTGGRFTSNYKSFMTNLYNAVNGKYPGKFRFDGSRIMSVDNYGVSLF